MNLYYVLLENYSETLECYGTVQLYGTGTCTVRMIFLDYGRVIFLNTAFIHSHKRFGFGAHHFRDSKISVPYGTNAFQYQKIRTVLKVVLVIKIVSLQSRTYVGTYIHTLVHNMSFPLTSKIMLLYQIVLRLLPYGTISFFILHKMYVLQKFHLTYVPVPFKYAFYDF